MPYPDPDQIANQHIISHFSCVQHPLTKLNGLVVGLRAQLCPYQVHKFCFECVGSLQGYRWFCWHHVRACVSCLHKHL